MSIIVAGGGLTGLTTALALGVHDFDVTLIGPLYDTKKNKDKRSTAIMMDGIEFLDDLGIWQDCIEKTAPLETMSILYKNKTIDFHARDMGKDAFAINIPNDILLKALLNKIKKTKNITLIEDKVTDIKPEESNIFVETEKKGRLSAKLLIAADGRQSTIRQAHNIKTKTHDFKQKALVCTFLHDKPHHNTSTEIHRLGGPFTVVPLPGKESALVWCDRPEIIDAVMTQSKQEKEVVIQKILGTDLLGDIALSSDCQAWPIHALKAKNLIADRSLLIGEAAHALAPIAAQGFNLSLRDIQCATAHIIEASHLGLDLGSLVVLKGYQTDRKNDIALRYHSVGFLNTLIADGSLPASILKSIGLTAMEWFSPMRHLAMRFGMRA